MQPPSKVSPDCQGLPSQVVEDPVTDTGEAVSGPPPESGTLVSSSVLVPEVLSSQAASEVQGAPAPVIRMEDSPSPVESDPHPIQIKDVEKPVTSC